MNNTESLLKGVEFVSGLREISADLLFFPFILSHVLSSPTVSRHVFSAELAALELKNRKVLERGIEELSVSKYNSKFKKLFLIDWKLPDSMKPFFDNHSENFNTARYLENDDYLDENAQDDCLQLLLEQSESCSLDRQGKSCLEVNRQLDPKPSGYRLTHNVFYLLILKMLCSNYSRSVDKEWYIMINLMYDTVKDSFQSKHYPRNSYDLDLLTETAVIGMLSGDGRFFSRDFSGYLRKIQVEDGCYLASDVKSSRHLLLEEETATGCLTHLTSVAMCYISLCFYYEVVHAQDYVKWHKEVTFNQLIPIVFAILMFVLIIRKRKIVRCDMFRI